jgi:hypothetical protein
MARAPYLADPTRIRGLTAAWLTAVAVAAALIVLGLAGFLSLAWGYALFATAEILLLCGVVAFADFALASHEQGGRLFEAARAGLIFGGIAYVWSVSALAGSYTHLAAIGEVEWQWILFGLCIVPAVVVLDVGLYRKLVRNNLATWRRFRPYISREQADPASLRRTLIDDVLLHRSLYRVSKVRWLRHTLIFWGFVAMFAAELVAVVIRDGFPTFGLRDIWREPQHPVRMVFDFIYDLTGMMMLVGCIIALGWRAAVSNSPERRYSDTPSTLFLLFVVMSGFVVEGLRMLPNMAEPDKWASFGGLLTARLLSVAGVQSGGWVQGAWLVHVLASCAFIAYVPAMRLVHSCATPLGRLMNSQKGMLAAKKRGVLAGMMTGAAASSGSSRNH